MNTHFTLTNNLGAFDFRIIKVKGAIVLQEKIGNRFEACLAICKFVCPNQAYKWALDYAASGCTWYAANIANILTFGAGEVVA